MIKLPRPIHGRPSIVELKKPDSEAIGLAGDLARKDRNAEAMLRLLLGSIVAIDDIPPDSATVKKMPLKSAEWLTVQAFKLYDLDTKMEGVYPCPRCGELCICEETKHGDNRDDLDDIETRFWEGEEYADGFVKHTLREPILIKRNARGDDAKLVLTITGQTFRDVLLGDMISVESNTSVSSDFSAQKRVMLEALIDVDATAEEEGDFSIEMIKRRYPRELVIYSDERDMQDILAGLQQYGFNPFKERCCRKCKKVWEAPIQLNSFFASALRSRSRGTGGASHGSSQSKNGRSRPPKG